MLSKKANRFVVLSWELFGRVTTMYVPLANVAMHSTILKQSLWWKKEPKKGGEGKRGKKVIKFDDSGSHLLLFINMSQRSSSCSKCIDIYANVPGAFIASFDFLFFSAAPEKKKVWYERVFVFAHEVVIVLINLFSVYCFPKTRWDKKQQ